MTTDGKLNVLLIGGWVDQAFTFVRSFARQEQINLFVADCWPNSSCGYSRHCRGFHLIPLYQDPQYLPAILDVCRKERIDIVLPVHHEDLVEVSKGKHLFEQAQVRLPIPSYRLIEAAVDKYKMAQIAQDNGVAVPKTYLLRQIHAQDLGTLMGFPVLVKLRSSTGQRGQKKVWSVGEFEAHVGGLLEKVEADQVIVQEYIPGHDHEAMYTVGLLYNHVHELRACIPLKKVRARPYTGGTAICTQAENRPELRDMAVRLLAGLGPWQGIADVECKIAPDGRPVFIELNPRPWGSMYGAYMAGVDLPMLWVKVALCQDFEPLGVFREGLYASFLSRDLMLLADLVQKLFTAERREAWAVLKTYTRPYVRRNQGAHVHATSDLVLDDLVPFVKNMVRFAKGYKLS